MGGVAIVDEFCRSVSESGSPEIRVPREADCGRLEDAERFRSTRRLASRAKELDIRNP